MTEIHHPAPSSGLSNRPKIVRFLLAVLFLAGSHGLAGKVPDEWRVSVEKIRESTDANASVYLENHRTIEVSVDLSWPGGIVSGKVKPNGSRFFRLGSGGKTEYTVRAEKDKTSGGFTADKGSRYQMTIEYAGAPPEAAKALDAPGESETIALRGKEFENFNSLSSVEQIALLEKKYRETKDTDYERALAKICNNYGVSLEREKRWAEANRFFTRAYELTPDDELIQRNLITHHNNYATDLSEKEQFGEAEREYLAARRCAKAHAHPLLGEVEGNLASLYTRWGIRDAEKGLPDSAIVDLRKALDLNPREVAAWAELGRIYYEREDLKEAERCLTEGARWSSDSRFDERLEKIRREVEATANYKTKEVGNFRISFEGAEHEEILRMVQKILRDAQSGVGRRFRFYPAREIGVVIYTAEKFHRVTLLESWAGAAYDGKIRIKVDPKELDDRKTLEKNLRRNIYHEYAHLVIYEMGGPDVPTWLHEGLAQYCEPENQIAKTDERSLASWARGNSLVSFAQLTQPFSQIADRNTVAQAYLQSKSFVDFLIRNYSMAKIQKVLRTMSSGGSVEDAFRAAYGTGLGDLEGTWRSGLV
jgi:tetratricopeptide (TPR) repeat protein